MLTVTIEDSTRIYGSFAVQLPYCTVYVNTGTEIAAVVAGYTSGDPVTIQNRAHQSIVGGIPANLTIDKDSAPELWRAWLFGMIARGASLLPVMAII